MNGTSRLLEEAEGGQSGVSRRNFIRSVGLGATAVAWTAKSYARIVGANDRIRIGFIGSGNMANVHMDCINSLKDKANLQVVAVADCWKTRAEHGAAKAGAEKTFTDYRRLLEIKNLDYVTIATPEHWHARMTIDALDAGKAVYCEKPLTHTIAEAQAVLKKQQDTNLPLQVGVQSMSDDSYSSAAKAIEEGLLGTVVQAQIEYVRRCNAQGPFRNPDVKGDMPKPPDLDWKAWLGPAQFKDWDPFRYFGWRCYSDYSGCIATDLLVHRVTRIIKACKLTYPRRVVGMGGIWQWNDGRDLPDNFEMICEYPRGMTVYCLGTSSNRVGFDHLIRGYRATMFFTSQGWVAKDKDGMVLAEHQKSGAEDPKLHHANLHNHLRYGEALNCPAELGLAGVVACCMSNESWRTSQMMGWNEQKQQMAPAHLLNLSHSPVDNNAQ